MDLNVVYGSAKQKKPAVNMERNLWEICYLCHLQHECFSTGDFGNLAGAENKETCLLVMGTLEKSNIQVWVAEQGCS